MQGCLPVDVAVAIREHANKRRSQFEIERVMLSKLARTLRKKDATHMAQMPGLSATNRIRAHPRAGTLTTSRRM